MSPRWDQVCELAKSAPDSHCYIKIELENGFKIRGQIEPDDAKRIFREPLDSSPIQRPALGGEVVVVLPASKVLRVTYPSSEIS